MIFTAIIDHYEGDGFVVLNLIAHMETQPVQWPISQKGRPPSRRRCPGICLAAMYTVSDALPVWDNAWRPI